MNEQTNTTYHSQIESWRQEREQALRAPDSWLSLAGLFPLTEGDYRIGSDSRNEIVLPASAPDEVGVITYQDGHATLNITTNKLVWIDGQPVHHITPIHLSDNANRKAPKIAEVGAVSFFLHKYGEHHGIRIKDRHNPAIAAFTGCQWFEIQPAYCCPGRLVKHDRPLTLAIQTTVQTEDAYQSDGMVEFVLHNQPLRLVVFDYGVPNQRSIVFRDATAGKSTYPPGRFLTIDLNPDDTTEVDFNKAYNPPCAFTPYATCPLPPRQNILPVAIEAGERYVKGT